MRLRRVDFVGFLGVVVYELYRLSGEQNLGRDILRAIPGQDIRAAIGKPA